MEILICGIYHLRPTTDVFAHEITDSVEEIWRQAQEVLDSFERFQPNAIAMEIDQTLQEENDDLYASFLKGRQPEINERDILCFPLAQRLNHTHVYCIDDMSSRLENPGFGGAYHYAMENEKAIYDELEAVSNHEDMYVGLTTMREKLLKNATAGDRHYNQVNALLAKVGVNSNQYGVNWLEWWYRRNAVMAGRLACLADEHERVLMFVGSSHVSILKRMIGDMGLYTIIDETNYLINDDAAPSS